MSNETDKTPDLRQQTAVLRISQDSMANPEKYIATRSGVLVPPVEDIETWVRESSEPRGNGHFVFGEEMVYWYCPPRGGIIVRTYYDPRELNFIECEKADAIRAIAEDYRKWLIEAGGGVAQ